MKKIIKKYYKEFLFRGLCSFGFGPLVLAVVYGILGAVGEVESISAGEYCLSIFSVSVLAFIVAGITVVFKMEELPLAISISLHSVVLYLIYAVVYLMNGWIENELITLLWFTGAFALIYILTWVIVYFFVGKSTKKMNEKICKLNEK